MFQKKLLTWYEEFGRKLPWRETNNPYYIWLSEIIMQQTRIEQGLAYYERFIKKYPTVKELADASEEDIQIIDSPVGMPGRAIRNEFIKSKEDHKLSITKCYQCIKTCNVKDAPYCITKALINAVKGNLDEGLIFCGSNVGRVKEIVPVHDLIQELMSQCEAASVRTA